MRGLRLLAGAAAALLALHAMATVSAAPKAEDEPQFVHVTLDAREYSLGRSDAPLTLLEFTDYQCPFCQRFHTQVYNLLKKDYIDTGKVRFYSRDLPLDQIHPNAMRAAQAARCAGEQGQFWSLREIMSSHPEALDLNSLVADATVVKINPDTFRTCVESGKYKDAVQGDLLEAMKIGADGTPAFVVGKSTADGVEGELIVGAQPYNLFQEKFRSLGVEKP